MTKGDIAKNNFQNGCNCAQAVLLAFSGDYGMDRETAMMIAASFGAGMGGLRETCGTVTGANMVIGLAKGKIRLRLTARSGSLRRGLKRKTVRLYAASCSESGSKQGSPARICARTPAICSRKFWPSDNLAEIQQRKILSKNQLKCILVR